MFVPEVVGDGQAGWCECPVGNVGVIRVPGAPVQGGQAAIHVLRGVSPVHLDQRGVIGGTVPVGRGGRRGGPGTCRTTR